MNRIGRVNLTSVHLTVLQSSQSAREPYGPASRSAQTSGGVPWSIVTIQQDRPPHSAQFCFRKRKTLRLWELPNPVRPWAQLVAANSV